MLLYSCGNSESEEREQKREQKESKESKIISDFCTKYKTNFNWDSGYFFTYTLQEKFIDKKTPLCIKGQISDIIKLDTVYRVRIFVKNNSKFENIYNDEYIVYLTIDSTQFNAITSEIEEEIVSKGGSVNKYNFTNPGCFIVRVKSIKVTDASVVTDIDNHDDEEEPTVAMDYYGFENLLIIKGDLIEYTLFYEDE
jgi:hypothetical protein